MSGRSPAAQLSNSISDVVPVSMNLRQQERMIPGGDKDQARRSSRT